MHKPVCQQSSQRLEAIGSTPRLSDCELKKGTLPLGLRITSLRAVQRSIVKVNPSRASRPITGSHSEGLHVNRLCSTMLKEPPRLNSCCIVAIFRCMEYIPTRCSVRVSILFTFCYVGLLQLFLSHMLKKKVNKKSLLV